MNGKEISIYKNNINFMLIKTKEGNTIELIYKPTTEKVLIYGLASIMIFYLFILNVKNKKK